MANLAGLVARATDGAGADAGGRRWWLLGWPRPDPAPVPALPVDPLRASSREEGGAFSHPRQCFPPATYPWKPRHPERSEGSHAGGPGAGYPLGHSSLVVVMDLPSQRGVKRLGKLVSSTLGYLAA